VFVRADPWSCLVSRREWKWGFGGFLRVCVPETEQNLKKPEKTCGNRRNAIDKARGKAEGELRYGSPHPHEH
jgi:hypothetical protein